MKFLVEKNVKDFFKFDKVRLFKLLEVTQYASISLVVCVIMATYIDKLFPELDKNKELHITTLEVVVQFVVLILSFYYIQKFVGLFPFYLQGLFPKYKASLDHESHLGLDVGLHLILFERQDRLRHKISHIVKSLRGE
jgi:hypothetical protein